MEQVDKPWGWYKVIDFGDRYKTKKIEVNPGNSLSLQLHYHRAEHWVVIMGTALVQIEDKKFLLGTGESTYIPSCTKHRLSNPGKIVLRIVEVQSGPYLEEDDIVRYNDNYGRD